MKTRTCSELWRVEAARDLRLSPASLASLEQHLSGCADCRRERAALQALSAQLVAGGAEPLDELAMRRLRRTTLARADASLHATARAPGGWLVGALACVVVALGVWAAQSAVSSLWPAHRESEVRVSPAPDAVWTRYREAGTDVVALTDGRLDLAIRKASRDARVLVRVPDGELEDQGTRFSVWVRGGHTAEIAVSEGSVVFRRAGQPSVELRPGMVWRAEVTSVPAVSTPAADSVSPAAPTPAARDKLSGLKPLKPRLTQRPAPAPPPSLVAVAKAAPANAATEDAAYLRIVALLRERRDDEARSAALRYLRDFPDGFRRREVEHVAQPARRPAPLPAP